MVVRVRVKEPISNDEFAVAEVAKKARGESPPSEPAPSSRKKLPIMLFKPVLFISLLIFGGLGFYAYALRQERDNLQKEITQLKKDPAIVTRQQNEELLSKVGELIELPEGEDPTIADVTDVEKAKQQDTFFKDARNGDKVLFYVQAGKAILYRPSTNKVITIAPIAQPRSQ